MAHEYLDWARGPGSCIALQGCPACPDQYTTNRWPLNLQASEMNMKITDVTVVRLQGEMESEGDF